MMYSITQLKEGRCRCRMVIQDDIEIWETDNLQQAVQSMIRNAEALNHAKITLRDIRILQENQPGS